MQKTRGRARANDKASVFNTDVSTAAVLLCECLMLARFSGPVSRRSRIVELVRCTKPPDTADSRPALFNRKESAICATPAIAGINSTPRIRVIRHGGLRRKKIEGQRSNGNCENHANHRCLQPPVNGNRDCSAGEKQAGYDQYSKTVQQP